MSSQDPQTLGSHEAHQTLQMWSWRSHADHREKSLVRRRGNEVGGFLMCVSRLWAAAPDVSVRAPHPFLAECGVRDIFQEFPSQ